MRRLSSLLEAVWTSVSNASDGKLRHTLTGHTAVIKCVLVTPDNRTIISASDDNTIRTWDMDSGKHLKTLSGHE